MVWLGLAAIVHSDAMATAQLSRPCSVQTDFNDTSHLHDSRYLVISRYDPAIHHGYSRTGVQRYGRGARRSHAYIGAKSVGTSG
jgi:hypothetical protein